MSCDCTYRRNTPLFRTLSSARRLADTGDEWKREHRRAIYSRHEKTVSRKRVGTRWTGCCRARSVCPEQASFPFATFPARTLPLSARRRVKLTRTIHTDFPFIPSRTVRDTVSRLPPPPPPPPPRGLVKFRNSARPWLHLPPSRSAKSFFKLRLAAGRSETVRQRGKKRSRREPLGLFPTSSAVQTRRMPKPRPLSTGSPSTLFRRHRFSGEYGSLSLYLSLSLSLSLDRTSRDRAGETSRRDSH